MFEVLVFVYENYWRGDACPSPAHLQRKLNAVGFQAQDISEALAWLVALRHATRGTVLEPGTPADAGIRAAAGAASAASMRVYSTAEQSRLGPECLGFILFLEASNVLPVQMREIVVERAMACGAHTLSLDDLKIIVLMVYWSLGEEPDALVLDELCDDASNRVAH